MPKPIVQAIVICDHIYQDKQTNKTVLSGTFSSIKAYKVPAAHGNLAIYIALTDVSENGRLQVVLRSLDDESVSFPLPPWNVQASVSEARLRTVELGANYSGLQFPIRGTYEFAVYWNEQYLCGKKVTLDLLTTEKGAQQ